MRLRHEIVDLVNRVRLRSGARSPLLLVAGGVCLVLAVVAARPVTTPRVAVRVPMGVGRSELSSLQDDFRRAGLPEASFEKGQLMVPADRAGEYQQLIARKSVTEGRDDNWAGTWQSAVDRLGHFSGSRDREAAREMARATAVSRLISALPDVAHADVVWDETPARGWRDAAKARATVYLQSHPGRSLSPEVIDSIRRAVAGSKANLKAEDVTVFDQTRMIAYDGQPLSESDARVVRSMIWQKSRIEAALDYLEGVRVDVQMPESTAELTDRPSSVVVSIPEQTVRALAGLQRDAGSSRDPEERRRLFRAVERHLHATVREKVRHLYATDEPAEGGLRVSVDTIPAPVPAALPEREESPQLSSLVTNDHLMWVAVATGVGALWMLTSGLGRARPTREAVATIPAAMPSPTVTASADAVAEPVPEGVCETPETMPQLADPRGDAGRAATPAMLVGERHTGPSREVLQDVLQRLKERQAGRALAAETSRRGDSTEKTGAGSDSEAPRPGGVNRLSEVSAADQADSVDIEQLAGARGAVLRRLATEIDRETWSKALYGTSTALQAQILPYLEERDAALIGDELRSGRPLRLREIDSAQREVLSRWRVLEEECGAASAAA